MPGERGASGISGAKGDRVSSTLYCTWSRPSLLTQYMLKYSNPLFECTIQALKSKHTDICNCTAKEPQTSYYKYTQLLMSLSFFLSGWQWREGTWGCSRKRWRKSKWRNSVKLSNLPSQSNRLSRLFLLFNCLMSVPGCLVLRVWLAPLVLLVLPVLMEPRYDLTVSINSWIGNDVKSVDVTLPYLSI